MDIKDSSAGRGAAVARSDGCEGRDSATSADGGTAIYNGLYLTLKEMTRQRRGGDRHAPPGR